MAQTRAQRVTLWGGAIAALTVLLFPPIAGIDGNDVGYVRYCCLLFPPRMDYSTFIWPFSLFLIGCEWAGVLLVTLIANAAVYSLARRGQGRRAALDAGGEVDAGIWPPTPRDPAV